MNCLSSFFTKTPGCWSGQFELSRRRGIGRRRDWRRNMAWRQILFSRRLIYAFHPSQNQNPASVVPSLSRFFSSPAPYAGEEPLVLITELPFLVDSLLFWLNGFKKIKKGYSFSVLGDSHAIWLMGIERVTDKLDPEQLVCGSAFHCELMGG